MTTPARDAITQIILRECTEGVCGDVVDIDRPVAERVADSILAALPGLGFVPGGWMPIETHPKDGWPVFVYYMHAGAPVYRVARWRRIRQRAGDWLSVPGDWNISPTHWLRPWPPARDGEPLPAPPTAAQT